MNDLSASKRRAPNLRAPLRISVLAACVLEGFREPAGRLADALTPSPPEPALRRVAAHARRDRGLWPR